MRVRTPILANSLSTGSHVLSEERTGRVGDLKDQRFGVGMLRVGSGAKTRRAPEVVTNSVVIPLLGRKAMTQDAEGPKIIEEYKVLSAYVSDGDRFHPIHELQLSH